MQGASAGSETIHLLLVFLTILLTVFYIGFSIGRKKVIKLVKPVEHKVSDEPNTNHGRHGAYRKNEELGKKKKTSNVIDPVVAYESESLDRKEIEATVESNDIQQPISINQKMNNHDSDLFAKRFKKQKKIGMGNYSEVWVATDQMYDDTVVALKIYALQHGLDDRGLRRFRREYTVILDLKHDNLLTPELFDVWEIRPYLILPYLEKGSLKTLLAESGTVSERDLAEMLLHISNALVYLHTRDILHQHITPGNILIGSGGEYLLSDFGLSDRFRSMLRKSTLGIKNKIMAYTPPESFDVTAGNHPAGDVFSLGVVACELAIGDLPWDANNVMESEEDIPRLLENHSAGFRKWIIAMISREPSNRPSAQQIASAAEQYLQKGVWTDRP